MNVEDETVVQTLKMIGEIHEILKKYETNGLFSPKGLCAILRYSAIESCNHYNNYYSMLGILTETLTQDLHEIWLEAQDEKENTNKAG